MKRLLYSILFITSLLHSAIYDTDGECTELIYSGSSTIAYISDYIYDGRTYCGDGRYNYSTRHGIDSIYAYVVTTGACSYQEFTTGGMIVSIVSTRYTYGNPLSCPSDTFYNVSSCTCDTPTVCELPEVLDATTNTCTPPPCIPIDNTSPIVTTEADCALTPDILNLYNDDVKYPTSATYQTCDSTCYIGFTYCASQTNYDSVTGSCSQPEYDDEVCPNGSYSLYFVEESGVSFPDPLYSCSYKYYCVGSEPTDLNMINEIQTSCSEDVTDTYPTTTELTLDGATTDQGVLGALKSADVATAAKQDKSISLDTTRNSLLTDIKNTLDSDLSSMNEALQTANSNIANANIKLGDIDGSLDGIKASLDGALYTDELLPDMGGDASSIDSLVSNITDAVTGMQTDIENAVQEVEDKKTLLENGFTISGTKEIVTSCPVDSVFDMGNGQTVPFSTDYCEPLSDFYSTGYTITYIGAVSASLGLFFLMIVGL